jgi:hypothetical protein
VVGVIGIISVFLNSSFDFSYLSYILILFIGTFTGFISSFISYLINLALGTNNGIILKGTGLIFSSIVY